jgi:4-amino-4-deoxy-L-arabinose transferase-like glycosyltransferase
VSVDAPAASGSRTFAIRLTLIALGALAIRIAAAYWYDAHTQVGGDAVWFTGVARNLVNGDGFIEPLNLFLGRRSPTAAHPPLYPLYLSMFELVRGSGTIGLRLWSALPGVGTVVLLGLLGRDLFDERAGLLAAALGAISISLFAQDVLLWSEGLYGFTIALTVFAAYRYLRRPDLLHAALFSAAIALATLTRAEAAVLFLILFLPLALRGSDVPWSRRFARVGVGALVGVLLLAPWVGYNNSGRFEHPVFLTVSLGTLLGSANCDVTYQRPGIGAWGGLCAKGLPDPLPLDESEQERLFRDAGLDYMSDHLDRLPVVVPFRVLRSFGAWAPNKMTADDLLLEEGGAHWVAYLVTLQYWLYLGLAIIGGRALYRRRVALLPFVAPFVMVALISVIGYGTMRFRIAVDVLIPVLAGVAISAWLARGQGVRAEPESEPRTAGTVAFDS